MHRIKTQRGCPLNKPVFKFAKITTVCISAIFAAACQTTAPTLGQKDPEKAVQVRTQLAAEYLKNGEKKEATLITRINTENTKNEYIYYFIKNTDNNNVSIYASKIVKEDSKEIMKDLDNEDERQEAYKIFSETYKSLRESEK